MLPLAPMIASPTRGAQFNKALIATAANHGEIVSVHLAVKDDKERICNQDGDNRKAERDPEYIAHGAERHALTGLLRGYLGVLAGRVSGFQFRCRGSLIHRYRPSHYRGTEYVPASATCPGVDGSQGELFIPAATYGRSPGRRIGGPRFHTPPPSHLIQSL